MPYHVGWGEGLWIIGGVLVPILLVVLIVWALAIVIRGGYRRDDHGPTMRDPSRPSPHDILRERFARGEITEEQFEAAKKVLDRG